MSKRSKACEFSDKARAEIKRRDNDSCIFCQLGYHMPSDSEQLGEIQIMHFVPRSQGGLGIPENGACGCVYHHGMLDNGADKRAEMLEIFEGYLMGFYGKVERQKLIYDKWSFLKGE